MSGNIEHTGGTLKSNGVHVDNHAHDNVQSADAGIMGRNDGAQSGNKQPDRFQYLLG